MITGFVSHEETIIRHFIEDPELAEIMLQDAIAEGDADEVQRVQRRINEAKSRIASMSYWASLVDNAEKTAKDGKNIDTVIALVSRALDILKSAVPAGV